MKIYYVLFIFVVFSLSFVVAMTIVGSYFPETILLDIYCWFYPTPDGEMAYDAAGNVMLILSFLLAMPFVFIAVTWVAYSKSKWRKNN